MRTLTSKSMDAVREEWDPTWSTRIVILDYIITFAILGTSLTSASGLSDSTLSFVEESGEYRYFKLDTASI